MERAETAAAFADLYARLAGGGSDFLVQFKYVFEELCLKSGVNRPVALDGQDLAKCAEEQEASNTCPGHHRGRLVELPGGPEPVQRGGEGSARYYPGAEGLAVEPQISPRRQPQKQRKDRDRV